MKSTASNCIVTNRDSYHGASEILALIGKMAHISVFMKNFMNSFHSSFEMKPPLFRIVFRAHFVLRVCYFTLAVELLMASVQ